VAPPVAAAPAAPPIGPEVAVAPRASEPVAPAPIAAAPPVAAPAMPAAGTPTSVMTNPGLAHPVPADPIQAASAPVVPTPIAIALAPTLVLAPTAAPAGVDELRLSVPNYERLMVKPGDSISQIASDTYGQASPTVLDMMKMANPSIRNLDVISVGQELRLPQLDEGLAVLQQPDGRYALLLLSTPAEGRARDIGRALRQHGLETRVGKADFGRGREVWRVVIGDLPDKSAARAVGQQLQRVFREDARIAQMAE
jgi:hypothetical protein